MCRYIAAMVVRIAASGVWVAVGFAKFLAPSSATIGGHALPAYVLTAVGAVEIMLGMGWWIARVRTMACVASLFLACLFAVLVATGVVVPESCGCFGRMQMSMARHLLVVGVLLIIGSLSLRLDCGGVST